MLIFYENIQIKMICKNKIGPILRVDGSVLSNGTQRSWFDFGHMRVLSSPMCVEDSFFVPVVLERHTPYTPFIRDAKDGAASQYQLGLGAAARTRPAR